jgi:hypothetical protein
MTIQEEKNVNQHNEEGIQIHEYNKNKIKIAPDREAKSNQINTNWSNKRSTKRDTMITRAKL